MSDKVVNYSFKPTQFVEILSNIGGLSKSLIFIFGLIGIANNERKVIGKSIRNLYFVSKNKKENNRKSLSPKTRISGTSIKETNFVDKIYLSFEVIKFKSKDKMTNLKYMCCKKKKNLN